MLSRSLPCALALIVTQSAGWAQAPAGPGQAPHYRASELLRSGLAPAAGTVPARLVVLPIPTVRAAAAYAPLPKSAGRLLPTDTLPPAPRHDLTGVQAAPPYDLYQQWPEAQRKYTLPAPWAEPLPLQLLRGVLGR